MRLSAHITHTRGSGYGLNNLYWLSGLIFDHPAGYSGFTALSLSLSVDLSSVYII